MEKPILFSAPMVREILEGRKTQTRRVVKPQPCNPHTFGVSPVWGSGISVWDTSTNKPITEEKHVFAVHAAFSFSGVREDRWLPCPYGKPGDRLWVKEAWRTLADADGIAPRDLMNVEAFTHYEADGRSSGMGRLRPSISMPRWASRITLEITEVRVQRLQEISEEDAKAEGIEVSIGENSGEPVFRDYSLPDAPDVMFDRRPIRSYQTLWESIHGEVNWDSNPWVWAVSFRVVKL